jgi:hypothetical protein
MVMGLKAMDVTQFLVACLVALGNAIYAHCGTKTEIGGSSFSRRRHQPVSRQPGTLAEWQGQR